MDLKAKKMWIPVATAMVPRRMLVLVTNKPHITYFPLWFSQMIQQRPQFSKVQSHAWHLDIFVHEIVHLWQIENIIRILRERNKPTWMYIFVYGWVWMRGWFIKNKTKKPIERLAYAFEDDLIKLTPADLHAFWSMKVKSISELSRYRLEPDHLHVH